jgi:hypothetical protein
MTASPKSLEDTISAIKTMIAELKKHKLEIDPALKERVSSIELKVTDLESKQSGEDDARDLRLQLRSLDILYTRVNHPQYQAFISEIVRLNHLGSSKAKNLSQFLAKQPLKNRDTILTDYCNGLLDELMKPQISYTSNTKHAHAMTNYCTGYRPEDETLNQYLRHNKMALDRIKLYFSTKNTGNTSKDSLFCNELLKIQRDISKVLTCVNSSDYIKISKTIDKYQQSNKTYQANLILDALLATPLKERRHLLSGPSLVKNALATNRDGSLFVDSSGNIDFLRAPSAYRELTNQTLEEHKEKNVLALDENYVQTEFNVYIRISPETLLEKKVESRSLDSASTAMSPDSKADEMFKEFETSPSVSEQGLFKPITAPPEPEVTMVEKIRRSHDASGDIVEEDLDHPSDSSPPAF